MERPNYYQDKITKYTSKWNTRYGTPESAPRSTLIDSVENLQHHIVVFDTKSDQEPSIPEDSLAGDIKQKQFPREHIHALSQQGYALSGNYDISSIQVNEALISVVPVYIKGEDITVLIPEL